MALAGPTWRIADRVILLERCWGDEHVLYNCASGDTHLVNGVTAQALRILTQGPSDARTLGRRLADAFAALPDPAFDDEIVRLLARLDELGLIQRDGP